MLQKEIRKNNKFYKMAAAKKKKTSQPQMNET